MHFDRERCVYKSTCHFYRQDGECNSGCRRYIEMMYLLDNSGIPENRYVTEPIMPDRIDIQAYKAVDGYRKNVVSNVEDGNNIYIWSKSVGNGKSSLAIKTMVRYFDSIWAGNGLKKRGVFVHVPLLINQIHDTFNSGEDLSQYKSDLANVDLVIFDDIGANKLKRDGYDLSLLLSIIDTRVLQKKSSIYTSNISPSQLPRELGERLASRILGSCEVVELKGGDRRFD